MYNVFPRWTSDRREIEENKKSSNTIFQIIWIAFLFSIFFSFSQKLWNTQRRISVLFIFFHLLFFSLFHHKTLKHKDRKSNFKDMIVNNLFYIIQLPKMNSTYLKLYSYINFFISQFYHCQVIVIKNLVTDIYMELYSYSIDYHKFTTEVDRSK